MTIQEEMKARMESRPDKHTLAWWDDQFETVAKGYRGLTHAVNCVLAEVEDRDSQVKKLAALVESWTEELDAAKAAIGKLQAEVTTLKETVGKAREAYAELKKRIQ